MRLEGLGKFNKSPYRESNPRPSGLYLSALTTTLQRAALFPIFYQKLFSEYYLFWRALFFILSNEIMPPPLPTFNYFYQYKQKYINASCQLGHVPDRKITPWSESASQRLWT
jgi:hypothetical protein